MRNTGAAVCALLLLALAACSEDGSTKPRRNQRPEVRITAGAADSSAASYRVTFEWRGTDADGVVTRYQYAIDDTAAAAWHDTTSTSAQKRFRADQPNAGDPDTFTRWHSFYVRAVDDQGALSAADSRVFNATNIAPSSRITSPSISLTTWVHACASLEVRWVGEDLDGSRIDHQPAFYEYKQVAFALPPDREDTVVDSLRDAPNLLQSGGSTAWLRVPTSSRALNIRGIERGRYYAFAVRAVDEGGATEPHLSLGRNIALFDGNFDTHAPLITVREPGFGRSVGESWELMVPTGRPLRFSFEFPCDACGDARPLYAYGLDLPDSSDSTNVDPSGIGGWTPWSSTDHNVEPILFSAEDGSGDHSFWVKARCASDPRFQRMVRVDLKVVAFTFEKFALIVDDARMGNSPNDALHDAFLRQTLLQRAVELGDVDEFILFGGSADENRAPVPNSLPLETLARYQHVFWSEQLGQNTQTTGLNSVERSSGQLSDYLLAGGRLFIFGGNVVGTLSGGRMGSLGYPKYAGEDPGGHPSEEGLERDSFLWRYLHVRGPVVSVPNRDNPSSEDRASSGIVAARSLDASYPDLVIDPTKWNPDELIDCDEGPTFCRFRGGVASWEGIKEITGSIPTEGGLDSLYAARAYDRIWVPDAESGRDWPSPADSAIVAQRYRSTRADTLGGTQQGRVVWLGIQPWYFEPTTLQQAGRAAIDWLVTGH